MIANMQMEHEMQGKQFLSPGDVAVELEISSATVLRLIHAGHLPAIRVSDRIYRIPAASFEKYKSGALEKPFVARVGRTIRSRPHFGAGEELPQPAAVTVRARAR